MTAIILEVPMWSILRKASTGWILAAFFTAVFAATACAERRRIQTRSGQRLQSDGLRNRTGGRGMEHKSGEDPQRTA